MNKINLQYIKLSLIPLFLSILLTILPREKNVYLAQNVDTDSISSLIQTQYYRDNGSKRGRPKIRKGIGNRLHVINNW